MFARKATTAQHRLRLSRSTILATVLPKSSQVSDQSDSESDHMSVDNVEQTVITIQRFVRRALMRKRMAKDPLVLQRQMEEEQRNLDSQRRLKEICLYLVFLFVFSLSSVYVVQDQDIYLFGSNIRGMLVGNAINGALEKFPDIATPVHIYEWMNGPFFQLFYGGLSWHGEQFAEYPGFLFGQNKLMGGIRVGQLRVRKRECSHGINFRVDSNDPIPCYGDDVGAYDPEFEDMEPFGLGHEKFVWEGWNETYWTIHQERDRMFSTYRTGKGITYSSPAYSVVLPHKDAQKAAEMIKYMNENRYIDPQTRIVFVDFTVYNPMLNMFNFVRITFEFGKNGGVFPTYHLATVRLYTMFENSKLGWMALECLVIGFYVYYICMEAYKGYHQGIGYFMSFSVATHNLNLLADLLMCVFRYIAFTNTIPAEHIQPSSDVFYDFRYPTLFRSVSVYVNSFNAFLCWFKLVRYMAYVPAFALVTGTLYRSAKGVGGFIIIFCVVFYGFAAAFMMTFGSKLRDYRNMTRSTYSLLKALLGDFSFDELEEAQWIMGPLLFVTFIALAVFVVLNVLIAIISDAYAEQERFLKTDEISKSVSKNMARYLKALPHKVPVVGSVLRIYNSRRVIKQLQSGKLRSIPSSGNMSEGRSVQTIQVRTASHAGNDKSSNQLMAALKDATQSAIQHKRLNKGDSSGSLQRVDDTKA